MKVWNPFKLADEMPAPLWLLWQDFLSQFPRGERRADLRNDLALLVHAGAPAEDIHRVSNLLGA